MIDVVKRGIAVVAMLALIAEPGSCDGAKKDEKEDGKKPALTAPAANAPGAPVTKYPCARSVQAIVVQIWTITPEPITYRIDAFDGDGVPLVKLDGKPMVNLQDTVITGWEPPAGGPAVWEFTLCYDKAVSGYVKVEGGKRVKMGIRFYRLSLAMSRTEDPLQSEAGTGIVSGSYYFQAFKK